MLFERDRAQAGKEGEGRGKEGEGRGYTGCFLCERQALLKGL